jgi:predicted phage-related endonuclease
MPRNFHVLTCEQRSEAWYSARAGVLGASSAADMLARVKTGEAAARRDLRARLVVEKLTGQPVEDTYKNADMQRGIDLEPLARTAYEALTGELVDQVGFVKHDTLPIGCSPDGVIGDFEGGIEIKAPRLATHLAYWRGGKVPAEYLPQLTHTLFVTGADWWDFVSYAPQFPEPLRLFVVRLTREDVDLKAYELALSLFLSEVERDEAEVRALLTDAKAQAA